MGKTFCSLLLAGCATLSGCVIPYNYLDLPGVQGNAYDARTHKPLAGAEVTISGEHHQASTRTASDGSFSTTPQKSWGVYIVPADIFSTRYQLTINQPGYQPASEEIISNARFGVEGGGDTAHVGQFSLQRIR